jgi:hypothetical protein
LKKFEGRIGAQDVPIRIDFARSAFAVDALPHRFSTRRPLRLKKPLRECYTNIG